MILTLAQPNEAGADIRHKMVYEESAPFQSSKKVRSDEKPSNRNIPYKYNRKVLSIEGGRILLHLRRPLLVEVDPQSWSCHVEGWNLNLSPADIVDLPIIAARRFLILFSKAERGDLTEEERRDWINILDRVDYRRFSIDRSPPRYLEGELTDRQPGFVRVKWHDDVTQKIVGPVLLSLDLLNIGDHFAAYVKLGVGEEVKSIERLSILPPV